MPVNIKPNESKQDYISRCISTEIKAGKEKSQAAAICYSMWESTTKSLGQTVDVNKDERPPKEWFDNMVESLRRNPKIKNPEALANWIWHNVETAKGIYENRIEKAKEKPPKKWFYDTVEALRKNPNVDDPEALASWIWYYQKKKSIYKGIGTLLKNLISSIQENRNNIAIMNRIEKNFREITQLKKQRIYKSEILEKAISVRGYESPEPGSLPDAGKKILAETYASCRENGGDKTKCSKIAWGAVRNAGFSKSVNKQDDMIDKAVLPVGTRRQWKEGVFEKQPDGEWEKVAEPSKEPEKKEPEKTISEKKEEKNKYKLNTKKNPIDDAWGMNSGYIIDSNKEGQIRLNYDIGSSKKLILHHPDLKEVEFTEDEIKNNKHEEYIYNEFKKQDDIKDIINDIIKADDIKKLIFKTDKGKIWSELKDKKNNRFIISETNNKIYIAVESSEHEGYYASNEDIKDVSEIKDFIDKYKNMDIKEKEKQKKEEIINKRKRQQTFIDKLTGKENSKWNGTIYGNEKYCYKVYVNNIEFKLTNEQVKELRS